VFHYLRVNVTGPRIEISAIRSDGTTIETTTWSEGGPMKQETPPTKTQPTIATAAAGAPRAPVPGATPPAPDSNLTLWFGIGGIALLLALATVVLVLRR